MRGCAGAGVQGCTRARCAYNRRVRPRFYLPSLDASGVGELDEDEAGHLTRVLRLGVGAEIDVFDGRGRMFRARVVEAERRRVVVHAEEPVAVAPVDDVTPEDLAPRDLAPEDLAPEEVTPADLAPDEAVTEPAADATAVEEAPDEVPGEVPLEGPASEDGANGVPSDAEAPAPATAEEDR